MKSIEYAIVMMTAKPANLSNIISTTTMQQLARWCKVQTKFNTLFL